MFHLVIVIVALLRKKVYPWQDGFHPFWLHVHVGGGAGLLAFVVLERLILILVCVVNVKGSVVADQVDVAARVVAFHHVFQLLLVAVPFGLVSRGQLVGFFNHALVLGSFLIVLVPLYLVQLSLIKLSFLLENFLLQPRYLLSLALVLKFFLYS